MTDGPKKKNNIPLIGMLAVKNQLVTKAELEAGLTSCAGSENPEKDLSEYFLSQELISKKNIQRLIVAAKAISMRQKEYRFGAMALAKGFINKSVLDLALEEQEEDIKKGKKPRLIGDMMVEAGLLSQKQRDYILKLQNRTPRPIVKATDIEEEAANGQPQTETAQAGVADAQDDAKDDKAPEKKVEEPPELSPPEVIVGGIQLQLAGDLMAAFLSKTDDFDEDVLVADIKDELFDRGIVSGVMSDDMIEGFINSSGFKTQAFRVAKGIRPIQGQDAKIEFFFNTDYLKAGGMDENGNIDFKQRGEIPLVEKGTVLAEKIPRVEARWGQNIYGDEVTTEDGEDKALRFGKGAVLSEDGLKILAGVRGYPKYSLGGVIFVHDEYTTGGDVDFETGHIEFDGNVNVKGCIKSGFKVKGNDITTIELDGGIVEADGDLKVSGGINEGQIYARGNVYAKFIHNSDIICMGDVYVEKEIVDSTIESSGSCSIVNGKLISSKVSAKMGLMARNIGTDMASPSTIKVGYDAFTERELKKNKARVSKIKEKIVGLEEKKAATKQQNNDLQKEITELAHVQDRSQLEQREVEEQFKDASSEDMRDALTKRLDELKQSAQTAEENLDHCFERSEALETQIESLDRDISKLKSTQADMIEERGNLSKWSKENPGKAQVVVEGAILAGNTIIGKHSDYTVDKMIRHARISEILF
ncbi:MAG: FapA family protein, partial [Desulfobacterales bacterium]|nr:FapA family protein [Desulfobacterales bacterium]